MILCPEYCDDERALKAVSDFFLEIGFGRITLSSCAHHDEVIAFTSQLAHVASNAYIKSPTAKKHKGFSAGSYKDMTRVASCGRSSSWKTRNSCSRRSTATSST